MARRPVKDDAVTWLTQREGDLPDSRAWLSPGERARVEQMNVPKRRGDFLLGRWTAKRVLAARLGVRADAAIEVRAAADGAPEAFVDGVPSHFSLSLGHSSGRAIAVVGHRTIGADIERVEPRSQGLVDDFFTDAEAASVAACAPADRDRSITMIWSAKESALKALRRGLREDTRHVEVGFGADALPNATWRLLSVVVQGGPPLTGWGCFDDGFALTVVGVDPVQLRAAVVARAARAP